MHTLNEGQRVSFDSQPDERGAEAANLKSAEVTIRAPTKSSARFGGRGFGPRLLQNENGDQHRHQTNHQYRQKPPDWGISGITAEIAKFQIV